MAEETGGKDVPNSGGEPKSPDQGVPGEPSANEGAAPAAAAGVEDVTAGVTSDYGSQSPGSPDVGNAALDFTGDSPRAAEVEPVSVKYDGRPFEDAARRHIAYMLIALLTIVIAGVLILVAFGTIAVAEIKEFAVILGPVVTLVSAATGFYYGTKSSR